MSRTEGPSLDRLHVLDQEGSRRYVYPADVHGRFSRFRPLVFLILIAIYVALPFLRIGGHPAVLLDIAGRRFFLFGKVFNAQDVYLLFFLLTGIGFTLIVVAALFGRLWCGWACPQTVFTEGVFRRLERWIEGPAARRQAMARGPMDGDVFLRKLLKHVLYLLICFALAHVFLAYFVSMPGLLRMMSGKPTAHFGAFLWAMVMTGILYFDFFWFREQTCLILCPYGRLQSSLQDRDTIVIGYDKRRGEPRGKVAASKEAGTGDCVDCRRCIAVCPTGIDIRNGLQMECIGCAACIDACDEIMGKLGRPKGLVRYDSERGLSEGRRRFWRPRIIGYAVAGLVGLTVATTMVLRRQPFEANVVRAPGVPYVLDGELVRNQVLLHLINKNPVPSELLVTPAAADRDSALQLLIPQPRLRLESLRDERVPVVVAVPRARFRPGMEAQLRVQDSASGTERVISIRLMGPNVPLGGGAVK